MIPVTNGHSTYLTLLSAGALTYCQERWQPLPVCAASRNGHLKRRGRKLVRYVGGRVRGGPAPRLTYCRKPNSSVFPPLAVTFSLRVRSVAKRGR